MCSDHVSKVQGEHEGEGCAMEAKVWCLRQYKMDIHLSPTLRCTVAVI